MNEYILKTDNEGNTISVHDVQMVLLEMLKDIDKICKKHDIPYFLVGGSCLGAVRHNGFIPWDDDADIGMLYDDYMRFLEVVKIELQQDKNYYFQTFDTHKEYNVFIPAMKFRKRNTYVKEANSLLRNRCKDGDGLFIDVFIIDYIDERKWVDVLCRLKATLYMVIVTLIENIGINPYRLKKRFVRFVRRYSKKSRERGSSLIGFDLTWTFNSPIHPVVYKKDDIYPLQYHQFEDTSLPIPRVPKSLLDAEVSKDHMNYPPKKMQQPKHIVDVSLTSEDAQ